MSASETNSKAAEAVAAMEAGDDTAALLKLNAVKALLSVTHGEVRMEWNREHIDSLLSLGSRIRHSAGSTAQTVPSG